VTEGRRPSAPQTPHASSGSEPKRSERAARLHEKWQQLSFEQKMSIFVAPLLVAIVSGLVIPRINSLLTRDSKPKLEVVDLLVRNRVAEYSKGKGGLVQTKESVPGVEITLHNTGNQRSIIKSARFTVQRFVPIPSCGVPPTASLNISSTYDIELPTKPRIGQRVEVPVSQQLAGDEADRVAFRFGSRIHPEPSDRPQDALMYQLSVSLIHDNEENPINAGTVIVSVPGLPEELWTQTVASDPDAAELSGDVKRCLQSNTALVQTMLALAGERSSELADLLSITHQGNREQRPPPATSPTTHVTPSTAKTQ
jgi:hypothetical protein